MWEPDASAEELTSMLVDQVRGLRNAIKILAEEVDELGADVGGRDAGGIGHLDPFEQAVYPVNLEHPLDLFWSPDELEKATCPRQPWFSRPRGGLRAPSSR